MASKTIKLKVYEWTWKCPKCSSNNFENSKALCSGKECDDVKCIECGEVYASEQSC